MASGAGSESGRGTKRRAMTGGLTKAVLKTLDRIAPALYQTLCEGMKIRPEVEEVQKDMKGAIKYVASAALGAILASFPTVLAAAAASSSALVVIGASCPAEL